MTTDKITIPDRGTDPDDDVAVVINCADGVERCLMEAEALPDGAPEQLGVLLRGLLAAQVGTMRMLSAITGKFDAWPHLPECGEQGYTCGDRRCQDCHPVPRA